MTAALDAGVEFEAVFVESGSVAKFHNLLVRTEALGQRVFVIDDGVAEKIADATTPQPILAAVRFHEMSLGDVSFAGTVLVLHNVRDPGNVGTMIRSAAAFGATAVVLSGHSVDPYNPKTLRATAGAIFQLPVVVAPDFDAVVTAARARDSHVVATVVRGGESLSESSLSGPVTIVIGSEAEGLSDHEAAQADRRVTLKMSGPTESLNAGVTAGIVLYLAQSLQGHDAGRNEP